MTDIRYFFATVALLACLIFSLNYKVLEFGSSNYSYTPIATVASKISKKAFDNDKNYSSLWLSMNGMINNLSIYTESSFVDEAIDALRRAKVIKAEMVLNGSSYKWRLTLDGGQSVLFKPALVNLTTNERTSDCVSGCEHPQYEIAGFTLNRLFGLRNMPYTTGRRLSWRNELEPVASDTLLESVNILPGGDVCVRWACYSMREKTYCFKNGIIDGAVSYWIESRKIEQRAQGIPASTHHEFHLRGNHLSKFSKLMPGEQTFCNVFREIPFYRSNKTFGHVLDMAVIDYLMLNHDGKHDYILQKSAISFSIFIDYGLSLCSREDSILLAPVYQCCNIRRQMYENLLRFKSNFTEAFKRATLSDPLNPVLLHQDVLAIHRRLHTVHVLLDICMNKYGKEQVILDI